MARPKLKFKDPEKQKRHEAALAKRRARHARNKGLELAAKAAETDTSYDDLIAHEKARIASKVKQGAQKGAAQSPKIMSQARQDLADAFDLMGGVPALVVWGKQNPTDFYRLWSKLIPATAQKESEALPLETLLSELASREAMSVRDAAQDIGNALLEKGRKQAAQEDAMGLRPEEIN
jgi:hypothetical protein